MTVVIGPGQFDMAIARQVGIGKHIAPQAARDARVDAGEGPSAELRRHAVQVAEGLFRA